MALSLILDALGLLNALVWALLLKRSGRKRGFLESLFPLRRAFSSRGPASQKVYAMLVLYFEITLLSSFFLIISGFSNIVFLFFTIAIFSYELYIIVAIADSVLGRKDIYHLVFWVLTEIIFLSALTTYLARDFFYINLVDFAVLIVKAVLSIVVLGNIILNDRTEGFFSIVVVLSIFAVIFTIHMFTTGFLMDAWLGSFHLSQIAILFSLVTWLGGSICLHRRLQT